MAWNHFKRWLNHLDAEHNFQIGPEPNFQRGKLVQNRISQHTYVCIYIYTHTSTCGQWLEMCLPKHHSCPFPPCLRNAEILLLFGVGLSMSKFFSWSFSPFARYTLSPLFVSFLYLTAQFAHSTLSCIVLSAETQRTSNLLAFPLLKRFLTRQCQYQRDVEMLKVLVALSSKSHLSDRTLHILTCHML